MAAIGGKTGLKPDRMRGDSDESLTGALAAHQCRQQPDAVLRLPFGLDLILALDDILIDFRFA